MKDGEFKERHRHRQASESVKAYSSIAQKDRGGSGSEDPAYTDQPGPGKMPACSPKALARALIAAHRQRDDAFLGELKWCAEYESFNQAKRRDHVRDLPHDADPTNLKVTGWGVIFAQDADPQAERSLRQLLEHRRQMAGNRYKRLIYRPRESARSFLWNRYGIPPGVIKLDVVPFYLLIVGDPETIPYQFQYQLNINHAVGRIYFETIEEYASYARSVVEAETRGVCLARRATFFSVNNDDDSASQRMASQMIDPLSKRLANQIPDWEIRTVPRGSKERLRRIFKNKETPGLLLSACHGLEMPLGDSTQEKYQGSLICQDWLGPKVSPNVEKRHCFAATDVDENVRLHGLVAFLFACYGAGTPQMDDFPHERDDQTVDNSGLHPIALRSFVARLPQRLLGHPNGGALAVVGHIDRGWSLSFSWTPFGEHIETLESLEDALRQLFRGLPVGAAMRPLSKRYTAIAAQLVEFWQSLREGAPVQEKALAFLWTAHNDARNLVIVGDPAVRLLGGAKMSCRS